MKLKGERSRVDGRKALVVEIVGIIGGHNDTESRSAGDRFIAQDGPRQFYGVARSQLSRVTKSA